MLFERIKLEADEEIIVVVRKHWWIITTQTFAIVCTALLPFLLVELVLLIQPFQQTVSYLAMHTFISSYIGEIVFLYALWLLVHWMTLANFWTDYYLDLWAITNRRVVAIDQRGLFRRTISSFRLERLQDMNVEVNGVIATLLDYGTIEAQTASVSEEEFRARYMPNPREIKSIIIKAADELTASQAARISALQQTDGT